MSRAYAGRQSTLDEIERMLNSEKIKDAEEALKGVLKREPRNPRAVFLQARCKLEQRDFESSRRAIMKAMKLRPSPPVEWWTVACNATSGAGDFQGALDLNDRALKAHPGDPNLLVARATMLDEKGRREEAYEIIRPIAEAGGRTGVYVAPLYARLCRRLKKPEEAVERIRALAEDDSFSGAVKQRIWFALGDLHNAMKEYDEAFAAFDRANALEATTHDPEAHSDAIDEVIETWTRERIAALPKPRTSASHLIFVVGMPRSGTTLTEQILASHPRVHGAGELGGIARMMVDLGGQTGDMNSILRSLEGMSEAEISRYAGKHLTYLSRLAGRKPYVVDKMPFNFKFVGLIAALFPDARIIRTLRDPLDTCVSCYFQAFVDNSYACSLESLGWFYRDYVRIMDHWKDALDTPIYEIPYEELVTDQEAKTREMLEFCGLDFDEATLRFYELDRVARTASIDQVTQPIYTSSVQRWKRYEKHLEPLHRALAGIKTFR